MAAGDESQVVGPHTPVSNEPEFASEVEWELTEPSSPGLDEGADTTGNEVEDVEGHEAALARDFGATAFVVPQGDFPDIGLASFGPAAENVHGVDNRTQITGTSVFPWRALASLLITAADNSTWIGTGWFVGPQTLMTAGHCVYIKNSGVPGRDGWVKKIQAMPGRNGSNLAYGSVTSSSFKSVSAWTSSGDEQFDYGAIVIPTNLGNTVGWFGYQVLSDGDLTASVVNIAGYPGDKPAGTLWFQSNKVASVGPRKVDIDTAGGQSGAPVWRLVNGSRYGVAVHAYGGDTTNSGTRITSPVADNIAAWKA